MEAEGARLNEEEEVWGRGVGGGVSDVGGGDGGE